MGVDVHCIHADVSPPLWLKVELHQLQRNKQSVSKVQLLE